jgi:hypothetical protein
MSGIFVDATLELTIVLNNLHEFHVGLPHICVYAWTLNVCELDEVMIREDVVQEVVASDKFIEVADELAEG